MTESVLDHRPSTVREMSRALLREAQEEALAGHLSRAAALFVEVWMSASPREPELANTAAWELAWLELRLGDFATAATWFGRTAAVPPRSELWPEARRAAVRLCSELANGAAVRTDAPPSRATGAPAPVRQRVELPPLHVINLGNFQITRDGVVMPLWKARKPAALFRYLLARRQRAADKEELMELLWPDAPPREASHSLHVAVSTLRRHLDPVGDSYIQLEGRRYHINPEAPVIDDCHEFRRHIRSGEALWRMGDATRAQQAYLAAIACYGGDYYVDDADLSCQLAERERLLATYLAALDQLGRICMSQRLFEQAAEYYRRLVERDEYREDAHMQIMRCYIELGRRSDALQQYQHCAAILRNDLGIEPMPGTQQLYRAIVGP